MTRPLRGEIYRLKPGSREGKARPVVIVSRDSLNNGHSVVAIPFYSQQLEKRLQQEWCVFFRQGEGGLNVDCVAKVDEVSLIDKLALNLADGPLGRLDEIQMHRLELALIWSLDLGQSEKTKT